MDSVPSFVALAEALWRTLRLAVVTTRLPTAMD